MTLHKLDNHSAKIGGQKLVNFQSWGPYYHKLSHVHNVRIQVRARRVFQNYFKQLKFVRTMIDSSSVKGGFRAEAKQPNLKLFD